MEGSVIMREESEAGPSRSIEESLAHNLREQKHSIFLSHSSAQKPFARRLRNELKRNAYNPFFDEDPDSLRRGEPFVQHLKDAARQADVAVVVLSDEFVTSKWPMIELEIFIEEQKRRRSLFGCRELNILPLFMGFSVEEFRDDGRRAGWLDTWQKLVTKDGRLKELKWEEALGVVGGINGVKYSDFNKIEEDYINNIVSTILNLVPPDVMWGDTHVRGKLKLCEAAADVFSNAPPNKSFPNVRAIGLHGMGGLGKTTICKSLCDYYFAEFSGKVWHVELGNYGAEEIYKDVLRNLVGISESLLERAKSKDQLRSLLRKRIEHKVFIAIDNVWNEDISREQAEAFLGMGFHPSSLVVVTSRSRDLLEWLGINKECCVEMPELDKDDATALLLQAAAPGLERGSMTDTQLVAVDKVVERCLLTKGPISSSGCEKQYVPLALVVLGRQLRLPLVDDSMKLTEWVDRLDLKQSDQKKHPIFSVLRLSFDNLPSDKHRSIFLDVALYAPRKPDNTSASIKEVCKWLSIVYNVDIHDIRKLMEVLQRDGLLDRWKDLGTPCWMHELYLEFAKAEASKDGNFDDQVYLYQEGGLGMPEMHTFPCHALWRLKRVHFYKGLFSKLRTEELQLMGNVEVLKLDCCLKLGVLDLQCMKSLRSLEIRGCSLLQRVKGLKDLKHVKFFRWNNLILNEEIEFPPSVEIVEIYQLRVTQVHSIVFVEDHDELGESTLFGHRGLPFILSLFFKLMKVVFMYCCTLLHMRNLQVLHTSSLQNLQVLIISCCYGLEDLGDLSLLMGLQEVYLDQCESLLCLQRFRSPHLKVLHISWCNKLKDLGDLSALMALQEVHLKGCASLLCLQSLHSPHLKILHISWCNKLKALGDLSPLMALQEVHLRSCASLLHLQRLQSLHLEVLRIVLCNNLKDLGDLSPLMALQEVHLKDCGSLLCLRRLQSPHLEVLRIVTCNNLKDLGDLSPLMALQEVHLKFCRSLLHLQRLQSPHLKVLHIVMCNNLKDLGDLSPLMALQEVHLKGCASLLCLQSLHSPHLKILHISWCNKLKDLGDLSPLMALQEVHLEECGSLLCLRRLQSPHLKVLHISWCIRLEDLGDLSPLMALQEVHLRRCASLLHLQRLQSLHLEVLRIVMCNNLKDLGDLSPLMALQEVHLEECGSLLCLRRLQSPHLKVLHIVMCNNLKDLGDLSALMALQEVHLEDCGSLLCLRRLQSPHLKVLHISWCNKLKDLGDLSPLMALQEVHLEQCGSLLCLRRLQSPHLKVLHISWCIRLEDLGDLSPLMALQEVHLEGCGSLLYLQSLHSPHLKILHISWCVMLKDLGDLSPLMALQEVHLEKCGSLLHLQRLQSPHLKVLRISWCNNLKDLGDLSPLMALEEVHLEGCPSLSRLQSLQSPHLKTLHISSCDKLEDLGDLSSLMALQL